MPPLRGSAPSPNALASPLLTHWATEMPPLRGLDYTIAIHPIGWVMIMAMTRVSAKYQVGIPREIRERHVLKPGQEIEVISRGDTIVLIPDHPLDAFRGLLRDMPTKGHREKKDRHPPTTS
jgi:AbrB family looped-hinge helix DNA binding protein